MPGDNWVRSLGLDNDGTLFVEIDKGLRLYDLCPGPATVVPATILPSDLMRAENRQLYYRFLATLKEIEGIIFRPTYDGSFQAKEGDIVVDAGARIGTFAAKVSTAVGKKGRVIAIEPEPHNFACLQKNVEANRLNNVIAIQKMLWSHARPLDLFLSSNNAAHSAYFDAFYGSTQKRVRIQAQSLDGILEELGIESVNLVKMDIEGSEIEALKGMKRILKSDVQLAIAAYHPVEGRLAHTIIIPYLERLGFAAKYKDGIVHAHIPSRAGAK